MSIPLESLPPNAARACDRLRAGLAEELGAELVALWAYGASTFPERPQRLGDVDTHGVLRSTPPPQVVEAMRSVHDATAREHGIEWDSWYVLEADASLSEPPRHALRPDLIDEAWALHRAHWLAGQFVLLHGCAPRDLVQTPSWVELLDGLEGELEYLEERIETGNDDPLYGAFIVWNACRILFSLRERDVVVSKLAAARWALNHLPTSWATAIEAAGRVYAGRATGDETGVMRSLLTEIVSTTRDELLRGV